MLFEYDNNTEFFAINRVMPKKIPGYAIYMNVPWTDVAIQNLPRDIIGKTTDIIKENDFDCDEPITETIVNDTYTINKVTPNHIISGETFRKNEKIESNYTRMRKIPVKKTKKYPTKKKNEIALERKNSRFEKYNMMNNYGN